MRVGQELAGLGKMTHPAKSPETAPNFPWERRHPCRRISLDPSQFLWIPANSPARMPALPGSWALNRKTFGSEKMDGNVNLQPPPPQPQGIPDDHQVRKPHGRRAQN